MEGGLNTYLYVFANPNRHIDPDGLVVSVPGAVLGAVSGGTGGAISGGGLGALAGAVAGAVVGAVNPFAANAAGLAAGNLVASLLGQGVGNLVTGKSNADPSNFSAGAAIGAAAGGVVGGKLGTGAAALIDPIRRPVVGSLLGQSILSRANQHTIASVIEGTGVGVGELLGSRIETKLCR